MLKKILPFCILIILIASTGKGLTSWKESQITSIVTDTNETEYWAVIVSTFDFNPIYDGLKYTKNWGETNTKSLSKENATRQNILDALNWLTEHADENDIVLFSDNSHGTRRGDGAYGIVPWDHKTNGIITVNELDEKFDTITAKGLCLIFDCCLAGNFVDTPTTKRVCIAENKLFEKTMINGVDGENRVVLMASMKYGLSFHMSIGINDQNKKFSFGSFLGEAFQKEIDLNNDGFCSAEEAFYYAKEKWRPFAIALFLFLPFQLTLFLRTGFFLIPFPTINDGFKGDLPVVLI